MLKKRLELFKQELHVIVEKKSVYKPVKKAIYSEIQMRAVVYYSTKTIGKAVNIYFEWKKNATNRKHFYYNAIFISKCTLNISLKSRIWMPFH